MQYHYSVPESDRIEDVLKNGTTNRKHKDHLFTYLFGNKKPYALSLYNAVNGSSYDNPEDISFNTIDDVIFMGMKNDVSFIIGNQLNVYEHQSTFSPNLPLRMLFYVSHLLEGVIEEKGNVLYSPKRISLPNPKFIVFYNGEEETDDERIMRLSESFPNSINTDLELEVRLININFGHSKEIMKSCRLLYECAWFVQEIRNHKAEYGDIQTAVRSAIMKMPKEFEIYHLIIRNMAEVTGMILTEWDEKEYARRLKKMYEEDAHEEWRKAVEQIIKSFQENGIPEETIEIAKKVLDEISV